MDLMHSIIAAAEQAERQATHDLARIKGADDATRAAAQDALTRARTSVRFWRGVATLAAQDIAA